MSQTRSAVHKSGKKSAKSAWKQIRSWFTMFIACDWHIGSGAEPQIKLIWHFGFLIILFLTPEELHSSATILQNEYYRDLKMELVDEFQHYKALVRNGNQYHAVHLSR